MILGQVILHICYSLLRDYQTNAAKADEGEKTGNKWSAGKSHRWFWPGWSKGNVSPYVWNKWKKIRPPDGSLAFLRKQRHWLNVIISSHANVSIALGNILQISIIRKGMRKLVSDIAWDKVFLRTDFFSYSANLRSCVCKWNNIRIEMLWDISEDICKWYCNFLGVNLFFPKQLVQRGRVPFVCGVERNKHCRRGWKSAENPSGRVTDGTEEQLQEGVWSALSMAVLHCQCQQVTPCRRSVSRGVLCFHPHPPFRILL